jgi:DHA2 family lincomycin resistance protein-like MFS transporter
MFEKSRNNSRNYNKNNKGNNEKRPLEKINPTLLVVIVAVSVLTFAGILSETGLNIAYSRLMVEFGVKVSLIQWLTTGYLLTLAIVIPVSPVLVRNFKTKRLFQTAAAIFFLGTVCCACASSFWMLLAGRIIQAVGTSISLPLLTNIVLDQAPTSQRGFLMGIVGLVTCFAPALGPVLSGFLMEYLNWHWIFVVMLPFLLISFYLGSRYIVNIKSDGKIRADICSVVLSAIGFAGIVYGVSISGAKGWNSKQVCGCIIIGVLSIGLFAYRQSKLERPLIHIQVFKYPIFSMGVGMLMIVMMTILATGLILPLIIQQAFGMSSMMAALVMLPGAVLNGVFSPLSGKFLDKKGAGVLLPMGFFIVTCMLFLLAFANSTLVMIIVVYALMMCGAAMLGTTSQTIGLNQLPEKFHADGSAVMNTMQQVSGAIGTAIASSIMANSSAVYAKQSVGAVYDAAGAVVFGSHRAFLFYLAFACAGLLISLRVRRCQPQ